MIYAGTGEACIRGNVSHGDGVYRSDDGGRTWRNLGLRDTRHIGRVRVDPRDADTVYVAALGHAWGPNRERGVFRSRNGGATWEHVLFRSERAGAVDLSLDTKQPARARRGGVAGPAVFPGAWRAAGRTPASGAPPTAATPGRRSAGIPGSPAACSGRIGVAVSPADGRRVYAVVEAEDGALFRSDDGGATWQRGSEEAGLRGRPWYYMHVMADPNDADTLWVADYSLWKSIDAGKTLRGGGDAARRQPRPLDRPRRLAAHDRGQ